MTANAAASSPTSQDAPSVAVIGGGMLGMTLALRLQQAGRRVVLYESRDHLGGLADAWKLGEVTWDRHYHVTLLSDLRLRKLLDELGVQDRMRWVKTKTGFFTDGQLHAMSNAIEFLRFPPLGMLDKFRLGGTIWFTSRYRNWQKLENELVLDYLTRLSGPKTAQKIWLPLLKAKLGETYTETSAAFIWATINRLYAARRNGLKEEMFGYMEGGYATTLEALGRKLESVGVEVRLGQRVELVEPVSSAGLRVSANGESSEFDQAVMTIPSELILKICPNLPNREKVLHANICYQGIVCASMLLTRPLSPFYVTNITDEVPFTGVIEMTALVNPDEMHGHHLVYLPKYISSSSPFFEKSDDEIRTQFVQGLRTLHPDLKDEEIVAFRISRAKYVMPIPTLGYSKKLPPQKSDLPGLFAVNGAQLVNATLNVNDIVKLAESAVEDLLANNVAEVSAVT